MSQKESSPMGGEALMSNAEWIAYADEHGVTAACWEVFDRWCKAYAAAHPDEDRTLTELIELFANEQGGDPTCAKGRP